MRNYIRATELSKKYNFEFSRLYKWAKRGWVKSKIVEEEIEYETGWGGKRWIVKRKDKIYYIDEDSFLAIPTFIRNKRRKKI